MPGRGWYWARSSTRSGSAAAHPCVGALLAAAFLLGVLAVGAPDALAVTEDEMYALWEQSSRQFESARTLLPAKSEDARWVQSVGDRIVKSWPDRAYVSHAFVVVSDSLPGAWSFPISAVQHKVYVTTGLLQLVRERGSGQRDDQLAGVLGHEIAHLMRDHHLLRQRRADMLSLEAPKDLGKWPAMVLGKWQQDDEFEADTYGAFYAMHAGYSFEGITAFLALYMRRYGDGQHLDLLGGSPDRPHPSLTARIAGLQREGEKVEQAERLFDLGLDLLRVGAWELARACFAQVRTTFKLSPTVAHNLAYAELMQYETSLSKGPPLEQAVSMSYATELTGKGPETGPNHALLDEAKRDFLKACELDRTGGFMSPRLGLACVYLYEEDDANAQGSLQEVQVGVDQPEYLNIAGVLAERANDRAGAQRAYCKALNLGPNAMPEEAVARIENTPEPYLPAVYNLARLLESQQRTAEAARLYLVYLSLEGSRSRFGERAQKGLERCGGQSAGPKEPSVVDSFRRVRLRSDGVLVAKAALGSPEKQESLTAGGRKLTLYHYPAQGITVVLSPREAAGNAVAVYVALAQPNRDPVAQVKVGDTASSVQDHLGRPRAILRGAGDSAWWDYASYGLALYLRDGRLQRCLIGGHW